MLRLDGDPVAQVVIDQFQQMNDVNILNPSDGDMLIYNGTSQKWENFSPPFRVVANPNGGYDVIYPN